MRYFQSGGGYFPEKSKDSKLNQRNKKRYLKHCENVVKDGDIGSGDYLITQLKLDVERGIEKDYSGSPLLERIHEDKAMIFDSCDKWISENMAVDNCLMTVNVVSLQIAILFTYASLDYENPTMYIDDKERVNLRFYTLTHSDQPDYDWRNFEHVYNRANSTSTIITEFLRNGIITVLDNLSIDTIIEQYLNRWYTCQIVYKKTFADTRNHTPFEYIFHDLVHYYNFAVNIRNNGSPTKLAKMIYTEDTMKKFYDFINKFECNPNQKYSVKVIFFIVIHESTGKWFEDKLFKGNLVHETHKIYEGNLSLHRFASEIDLLNLIPYDYRPSSIREGESQKDETKESIKHEEEKSPTRADRRVAYLNTALANYLYVLEEFKRREFGEKVFSIEYKSLDKQRLKRVEDMMKWQTTHKPIPQLLLSELESLGCELCSPTCCVSGGTRKRKKRKNKTRKSPGTVSHRHSL